MPRKKKLLVLCILLAVVGIGYLIGRVHQYYQPYRFPDKALEEVSIVTADMIERHRASREAEWIDTIIFRSIRHTKISLFISEYRESPRHIYHIFDPETADSSTVLAAQPGQRERRLYEKEEWSYLWYEPAEHMVMLIQFDKSLVSVEEITKLLDHACVFPQ